MNAPVDAALLDALLRTAEVGGITKYVVGAVIPDAEGRVLLLHRGEDEYFADLWELPSGGVEEDESLIEALHREVMEETGLAVATVDGYLGHFDYLSRSGRRTRQFNFTATTHRSGTVKLTEHDAHQWAGGEEQQLVSSAVRDVLARWRASSG